MGQVINLSEPSLDMYLYGNKSNILNNYLLNQLNTITPAFNEFSNRIYQSIQNSYNFINDKLIQYGIMSQINNQGIQVLDNYYMECLSFQDLQKANPTMQRWIMSEPQLRQLYLDQNLDGYSESYKNVFGKNVGEGDYNYRRVMDGALLDTDDSWQYKHYIEDLLPGDKELDHYEKTKIRHTYDAINYILDTCNFDFTVTSEEPVKINRR